MMFFLGCPPQKSEKTRLGGSSSDYVALELGTSTLRGNFATVETFKTSAASRAICNSQIARVMVTRSWSPQAVGQWMSMVNGHAAQRQQPAASGATALISLKETAAAKHVRPQGVKLK